MSINSSETNKNLASVVKNYFGINSVYGPLLKNKCFVGFQSFLVMNSKRQSIEFKISTTNLTFSASDPYLVDYSFICIADIGCPNPLDLYYPLIDSC